MQARLYSEPSSAAPAGAHGFFSLGDIGEMQGRYMGDIGEITCGGARLLLLGEVAHHVRAPLVDLADDVEEEGLDVVVERLLG